MYEMLSLPTDIFRYSGVYKESKKAGALLGYEFPNTITAYKMQVVGTIRSGSISSGCELNGFDFNYSADGNTYTKLFTATGVNTSSLTLNYKSAIFTAQGKYFTMTKLTQTNSSQDYCAIVGVQIWGRADV